TVRKHLSAIKGGRLAAATPASVLTLILSDAAADDLGVIGSGPTAPDRTTFLDAARIVRRYDLWERLPVAVRSHLVEGLAGGRRVDRQRARLGDGRTGAGVRARGGIGDPGNTGYLGGGVRH